MKGTLIKRGEGDYKLFVNDTPFGQSKESPYKKLSLKNCKAIENGYDLDELAFQSSMSDEKEHSDMYRYLAMRFFKKGFQKALELLGDKKFSEEDMRKAYNNGMGNIDNDGCRIDNADIDFKDTIDCMQEYKWQVEISEVLVGECDGNNDNGCFMDQCGQNCSCFKKELNLDKDGCLILKKV